MDIYNILLIVSTVLNLILSLCILYYRKNILGDLIIFYDKDSDSAKLKFDFDSLDLDDLMKKNKVCLRIKNDTFKNSHE